MNDVSVIIVSWNARDYLEECLASIRETCSSLVREIIVVDNASTDGSAEMVARTFPNVTLVRCGENLGFAKANNIGIRKSSGKYVCLVNSDVKVLTACMSRLIGYLEANPEAGLVGPRMLGPDGKVVRSCRGFPTVWNLACAALGLDVLLPNVRLFGGYFLRYWAHDTTQAVDIIGGWYVVARRETIELVGLLDEEFFFYAEDMDWCKRFRLKGLKVVYVATAASIHYGGRSSQNAPIKYDIQQQRANLQYLRKYHSRMKRLACHCAFVLHQTTRLVGHGLRLLFFPGNAQCVYKVRRSWCLLLWLLRGAV